MSKIKEMRDKFFRSRELISLLKKIKKASANGQHEFTVKGRLSDEIITILEYYGFDVQTDFFSMDCTVIIW